MKKRYNIISLTILFVIGFLFVHSELDLFSPDKHVHNSHDFCDIVDNAKPENSSGGKTIVNSINVPIVFFSLPLNLSCNKFSTSIFNSNKPIPDINLNILYGSFLI